MLRTTTLATFCATLDSPRAALFPTINEHRIFDPAQIIFFVRARLNRWVIHSVRHPLCLIRIIALPGPWLWTLRDNLDCLNGSFDDRLRHGQRLNLRLRNIAKFEIRGDQRRRGTQQHRHRESSTKKPTPLMLQFRVDFFERNDWPGSQRRCFICKMRLLCHHNPEEVANTRPLAQTRFIEDLAEERRRKSSDLVHENDALVCFRQDYRINKIHNTNITGLNLVIL